MAGGRFQEAANLFIESMEAHAEPRVPPAVSCDVESTTQAAASTGQPLKKARRDRPDTSNAEHTLAKGSTVGVRRVPLPPLEVFQMEYMETATPVILTGVMEGWPALGKHSQESRDWSNPSYLRHAAGRRTVPVELGGSYTGEGWRQELMTVDDFIGRFIEADADARDKTMDGAGTNQRETTTHSRDVAGESSAKSLGCCRRTPSKHRRTVRSATTEKAYLAQHQLFDQIPSLRKDIITPDYCSLLLSDEEDDPNAARVATNAWFGPAGTVSPLHNDPFHNLLAQVVGSKRVLMVNRRLSDTVYPRPGLMSNTSQVDAANPDLLLHPKFAGAMPLLECELKRGEILYIPPLFWHHIQSLSVSFSVSFWWGRRRTLSEGY